MSPVARGRAARWARGRGFDLAVAGVLALAYVWLLVETAPAIGYTRDEGFYFAAADRYAPWLARLFGWAPGSFTDRAATDAAFRANHEHPALAKSLFALSHELFFVRHRWFSVEGTSYRFPAMVLAGGAVGLTYLWGARALARARLALAEARLGALVGALSLAFAPRFFFHAHLACFDVPIVALWLATAYAWCRSLERGGVGWPLATGVLFGLALDTKHNSWFLPIAAACHASVLLVWAGMEKRARARTLFRTRLVRAGASLASMLTLGPLVFVAGWPWLWWDTKARFVEYAQFHLQHEYYNMEFLGETYWRPPMPRAYAWVMTLATVPTVTLAAAFVGFVAVLAMLARPLLQRVRPRLGARLAGSPLAPSLGLATPAGVGLFWCAGLTINYAAWLSPSTPIFGGTKHWLTAYPFGALFVAAGVALSLRALRLAARRTWAESSAPLLAPLVAACLVAAPVAESARSHPFGLSHYVPLVGGPSGAASLGLNRTFWGYTTRSVADWLNTAAPPGARVYPHDTAWAAWDMLVRDGAVRRDLRLVATAAEADYVLYHHEPHMLGQEYQAWVALGTTKPAFVASHEGVPVVWVYERPR